MSVDGETAQTYQGGGADPNGGGYVAERGAVVTHNGKTFVIRAMAANKNTQPTVSEEEFNAFSPTGALSSTPSPESPSCLTCLPLRLRKSRLFPRSRRFPSPNSRSNKKLDKDRRPA